MNINSRINWQTGMELTPHTFISLDKRFDFKQQTAIRIALGSRRMGLIPGTTFSNRGSFVRNAFQIDRLQCMALLPSGAILHIDEEVKVKIPMLYGELYYLTVGLSEEEISFEDEGIPLLCPKYLFGIHTLDELKKEGKFPIVRFQVQDGMFTIDPNYIVPCLTLDSDPRFSDYINRFCLYMEKLATHANLQEGDGKRLFMRYFFLLKNYNIDYSLYDFVLFTQEMAQAIDYFVVTPNTEHLDMPHPSFYDIQQWLEWLVAYMEGALSILDKVELIDNSIDFEELKAQIKAEIYERLNPELYERLIYNLKEVLQNELSQSITSTLKTFLENQIKPQLYSLLSEELQKTLFESLFQTLYDALYKALYVPEEKKNEYIPKI